MTPPPDPQNIRAAIYAGAHLRRLANPAAADAALNTYDTALERAERTNTMDTSTHRTNPILLTTALVWDDLDNDEKMSLHSAVNWPGKTLKGILGSEKFEHLGTEENGAPHARTVEAINILAARWHRDAGRLSSD